MANKVEISAVLKRNLEEGKEYDKLIPRVKCERIILVEGDTFNTVDWIEKQEMNVSITKNNKSINLSI